MVLRWNGHFHWRECYPKCFTFPLERRLIMAKRIEFSPKESKSFYSRADPFSVISSAAGVVHFLAASVRKKSLSPAGTQQQNDVVSTSMRRDYVASTLIQRHFNVVCPLGPTLRNNTHFGKCFE